MPDRRVHRGPHPDDLKLFAPDTWPLLVEAIDDLCWLLNRGYPTEAARKLVGDRYHLNARQRVAVERCSCSDASIAQRRSRHVSAESLRGRPLWIDGYNLLTTIEAALSGGVILVGRDGCYRDMASMHGSYRKVDETVPALELLGRRLAGLEVGPCTWYFDRPVSNSGRLKTILQQVRACLPRRLSFRFRTPAHTTLLIPAQSMILIQTVFQPKSAGIRCSRGRGRIIGNAGPYSVPS